MPAEVVDGRALARARLSQLTQKVDRLRSLGVQPGFAVVLASDNSLDVADAMRKADPCQRSNVMFHLERLSGEATETEIGATLERLNGDDTIHGVMVQFPLPAHVHIDGVCRLLARRKDVDGVHPTRAASDSPDEGAGFPPAAARAVDEFLGEMDVDPRRERLVVVGETVATARRFLPPSVSSGDSRADVRCCAWSDPRRLDLLANANVIITCVNQPKCITGEMICPGAVVVDAGACRVFNPSRPKSPRIVGDLDRESVSRVARFMTLVPGGVGPMTVAMLIHHTVEAAGRWAQN